MEINIKDGYKVTEVGVIPDNWEVKKLEDIGSFKKGKNIPKKVLTLDGVLCVLYGEIYTKYNYYSESLESHISPDLAKESTEVNSGDILFAGSGETFEEIGKCFAYLGVQKACAGGDIIILTPNIDNSYFLSYLLNSYQVNIQKSNLGQGSSVIHIYVSNLKSIDIPLPPLAEQKAIAHALSDVDNLITAIDQLITKKRNLKQGTMQELLTGKKRLPGFSGKWEVKKVGDICDFIVPGRNKPKKFEGHIPWITTPDLEDGRSIYKSRLDLCISIDEAKNVGSKIVPAGSIIMSCAGELGITALTENEIVINQQLHAFIPSSIIDGWFLLNIIKRQKKYINSIATKTAVPYINKDNCNSIPIPLPPLPEQKAIAEILTDIDKEIEALEKKRDKYKAIKQGMMQELLTGKTRIIDN